MNTATATRPTPAAVPARKSRRVLCPVAERNAILSAAYLKYVLGESATRPSTRP